jgi:hypothetical protein
MDALLPDPGELLRVFLLGQPAVTAIVGDRISVALSSGEPSIRYAMVAGNPDGYAVASPLMQVECWGRAGTDDGTSSLLARTVVAVVPGMYGDFVGGRVAGGAAENWFPSRDPVTERAREIVHVRLLDHALV